MLFRVNGTSHFEQFQIVSKLWSEGCGWKVEPPTSRRFFLLQLQDNSNKTNHMTCELGLGIVGTFLSFAFWNLESSMGAPGFCSKSDVRTLFFINCSREDHTTRVWSSLHKQSTIYPNFHFTNNINVYENIPEQNSIEASTTHTNTHTHTSSS